MDMLKVNSTELLSIFIERYTLWKDCKNFHNNTTGHSIQHSDQGVPCYDYLDIEGINSCDKDFVVIDCMVEGIHSKNYFDQYNPNKHYLIFSHGWWDPAQHDFAFKYTHVWYSHLLFDWIDRHLSPNRFSYYLDKKYDFDYPKPCYFVSTVGNVRPERDILIDSIKQHTAYSNFILRYSGQDIGMPSKHLDVVNFEQGQFDPHLDILAKYYWTVSQSLPVRLYNHSYVNLIVESDLDFQGNFFLTEKTIKCLLVGQPFIVVSTPHFLKHLRNMGFQTYNNIWDEDYDNELCYSKRIAKIQQTLNSLADISWQDKKSQLMQIQQHNQQNFTKLYRLANEQFENFENIVAGL